MTNPAEYITGRTVQEQMNELIGYVDTRAAEVATSAIASDVADVEQAKTDAESARDAAIAARDTAISTVSDCVKKTPSSVQTITGYKLVVSQGVEADVTGDATLGSATVSTSITVPTVATGTYDTKAANGTKVKNELDNYSAMIRTTGSQNFTGSKTGEGTAFVPLVAIQSTEMDKNVVPSGTVVGPNYAFKDKNGNTIGGIYFQKDTAGKYSVVLRILQTDNTSWKYISLGASD